MFCSLRSTVPPPRGTAAAPISDDAGARREIPWNCRSCKMSYKVIHTFLLVDAPRDGKPPFRGREFGLGGVDDAMSASQRA